MVATEIVNSISISNLAQNCIENDFPFAIYRLPNQNKQYFILSFDKNPNQKNIDFETCESGFVMAPFDVENELPYIIKSDIFLEIIEGQCDLENVNLPNVLLNKSKTLAQTMVKFSENDDFQAKFNYINKVDSAIALLEKTDCDKVVLSRIKEIGEIIEINYIEIFDRLCQKFPNAFISTVYLPYKKQIWIGATPELLVSQNSLGIFKTVALAGTQASIGADGNKINENDALWSQKEIEEQAIVSRYIINCLKKIRVREFVENGPKTINAGNLMHLCSSFLIDTNAIEFSNFVTVMLSMLHPTPAVCGMPKDKAMAIINELENYNREFYSGYLGPINILGESSLYVNLRTMKIQENRIFGYAGGGLTAYSVAEKEWNETQIKLMTIFSSLKN